MKPPMNPAIAPTIVPDEHADHHAREADEQRRPGAVDDQRQHVALEAAGLAERMWPSDGGAAVADDLVGLWDVGEVERQQERADDRDDDQDREDPEADHRQAVLA